MSRYTYSTAVSLGRHTLRFKPSNNSNQRLLSFEVGIEPVPAGSSELSDLDGNESLDVWFERDTAALTIESRAVVQTLRTDPFDYLWQGEKTLPLEYAPPVQEALLAYRVGEFYDVVRDLASDASLQANGDAQFFLSTLNSLLYGRFAKIVRDEGDPLSPAETLQRDEASCRDLAVLYMAAARAQGFAARFVSGYLYGAEEDDAHDLHAWAEVYVPGGGWRGFDPTAGLVVADYHVAVAVGVRPEQASPVSGSYYGRATSELETQVTITPLDAPGLP